MKKSARARFAIKSWDEKPYSEGQDQPKLTRASVIKVAALQAPEVSVLPR